MINVKNTIYSTIKDRVDKLRFLAVNDSKAFKKILYLIIMDDVYDWSNYLGGSQEIQDTIQHLRYDFIRHNEEFLIERDIDASMYTNVNTPQTNNTWKRVWDNPNVVLLEGNKFVSDTPQVFVPDPNCKVGMVFFPGYIREDLYVGIDIEGNPSVDLTELTTCEKMNIFINRDNGKMYYLDVHCNWKPITVQRDSKITIYDLDENFPLFQGVEHSFSNSDTLDINLIKNNLKTEIPLVNEDDLEDVL